MAGDVRPTPIPPELVRLVEERRLIPFVGAGFSSPLGLPSWDDLLRRVSGALEQPLPFDDICKFANHDNLQIAEYLYLKAFQKIGPLRHEIEKLMPSVDSTQSGPHVELVNLGAPQIYTTNYDDLIESGFRALDVPVNVITLPRDVATARADVTQVVKYHGDLRHDETLVLTESSYYRRLDFESPMDLKFRSDLLGRAVLFMGYSFRDINIRIIWWKLMQMMKDIPESDRWPSYIVRLDYNPVLEVLDRAVGLQTLFLDPEGTAATQQEKADVVARFLYELSTAASSRGEIPGSAAQMWVSTHLVAELEAVVNRYEERLKGGEDPYLYTLRADAGVRAAALLVSRRIPPALVGRLEQLYKRALGAGADRTLLPMILRLSGLFGSNPDLTFLVADGLTRAPSRLGILRSADLDWATVWGSKLSENQARAIVERLLQEVAYHEENVDSDLAYAVDAALRVRSGEIYDFPEGPDEMANAIDAAVTRVYAMYPGAEVRVTPGTRPEVDVLLEAFAKRQSEEGLEEPF